MCHECGPKKTDKKIKESNFLLDWWLGVALLINLLTVLIAHGRAGMGESRLPATKELAVQLGRWPTYREKSFGVGGIRGLGQGGLREDVLGEEGDSEGERGRVSRIMGKHEQRHGEGAEVGGMGGTRLGGH